MADEAKDLLKLGQVERRSCFLPAKNEDQLMMAARRSCFTQMRNLFSFLPL